MLTTPFEFSPFRLLMLFFTVVAHTNNLELQNPWTFGGVVLVKQQHYCTDYLSQRIRRTTQQTRKNLHSFDASSIPYEKGRFVLFTTTEYPALVLPK